MKIQFIGGPWDGKSKEWDSRGSNKITVHGFDTVEYNVVGQWAFPTEWDISKLCNASVASNKAVEDEINYRKERMLTQLVLSTIRDGLPIQWWIIPETIVFTEESQTLPGSTQYILTAYARKLEKRES